MAGAWLFLLSVNACPATTSQTNRSTGITAG
jgi:hypothetical protein